MVKIYFFNSSVNQMTIYWHVDSY